MENEILITKHTTKSWFKSAVLGIFMGLAVIIPGVSGAQIAILFKLYDKLTYAISNIFKKFKLMILFLIPIVLGIGIGFVAGFFAVKELIELATFAVVALFAGMMLGGTPVYLKEIKNSKVSPLKTVLLVIGLIVPISIGAIAVNTNLTFTVKSLTSEWWMFLIAAPIGFVVAITQLIPGLSATSTLLSIGIFKPLMESVSLTYWKDNPLIFVIYLLLGIGLLVGVFVLSKIINKVIEKYKSHFYWLALGLSFSSIASMFYNPEIVGYYNGWSTNGVNTIELSIGIVLFCLGFAGIFAFCLFTSKKEKANQITQKEEIQE